jgi:hypothetical protein
MRCSESVPASPFQSQFLMLGTNLRPLLKTCLQEEGQGIIEYAIMLGIILVLVLGVLRLIETNALDLLAQVAKLIR